MNKKYIIECIYNKCKEKGNFEFDNTLVKQVLEELNSKTNPYDMTKFDDITKYPQTFIDKNIALIHIGSGRHKFIEVLDKLYPKFEDIRREEKIDFLYRPSILNEVSISESAILSTAYNHRIIHDFLYSDIVSNPKIYMSERKRGINFEYFIGNEKLKFNNLQIEIDLTLENNGCVTVFEAKNSSKKWIETFNIYQIYNPFRYYYELELTKKLGIKKINCCYLIRKKESDRSVIRLYLYEFLNHKDVTTLKLLKKREYSLIRREFDRVC
jgi:hypothetical protein